MTVYQLPFQEIQGIQELKQVEMRLREICSGQDQWTQLFSSAVTRGGKRLRPALVILCGSFLPAPTRELVDVATSVELIHAASLIHDDIIDQADSRRGLPTISGQWGVHQAVLYGDFLFARSFSLLIRHGYNRILSDMTRAISQMCEGEIEQYARRYDCSITEAEYMSYIRKKTAFFLSSCCLAGAEVSGLPPLEKNLLATFGLQLGYAFQMTDDILDICGTQDKTGKPVLHDLTEGYLTLPLIRLLQDPRHGAQLRQIINHREFTPLNMSYICETLQANGILAEAQHKAKLMISRAKQSLAKLPNKPQRAILTRLTNYILQRNY